MAYSKQLLFLFRPDDDNGIAITFGLQGRGTVL